MRKILFRGKSKVTGNWFYGNLVNTYSDDELVLTSILEQSTTSGSVVVDPDTVGQYTGLTDKNDKKIFEGDIIRYTANECSDIFTVSWDNKAARFAAYGLGLGENSSLGDFVFYDPQKCEVIGNIYDNPELLKEANNENSRPN